MFDLRVITHKSCKSYKQYTNLLIKFIQMVEVRKIFPKTPCWILFFTLTSAFYLLTSYNTTHIHTHIHIHIHIHTHTYTHSYSYSHPHYPRLICFASTQAKFSLFIRYLIPHTSPLVPRPSHLSHLSHLSHRTTNYNLRLTPRQIFPFTLLKSALVKRLDTNKDRRLAQTALRDSNHIL